MDKYKTLKDIYYDPRTGHQSTERLYQKAEEAGVHVNWRKVKEWFTGQDTYTRYKPITRRHKFRQTKTDYLGEQL